MEKQSKKINWKELTNNQLFCTVLGWILGIVSTVGFSYVTDNPILHDYISIDSVSYFVESYLVDTGFVDASVLEEESLDKKFQLISESFAQYEDSVESAMVSLGENRENVGKMERTVLLSQLLSLAEGMADKCADKDAQIEQRNSRITELETANANLEKQVGNYKQRKEAELISSKLIVDGELLNNGELVGNAMAKVDGHYYFEETVIESYLRKEEINYDAQNQTIVVGDSVPEKVKFVWDKMAFNPHEIDNYTLSDNSTFSMATKTYSEGIVLSENDYFYVQLDGKYSKMSFTYGHVDNTNLGDLELKFFAVDENNEAYHNILKTITLPGEMTTNEIEVPLGYAKTIKVVVSDGDDWDSDRASFGLTNIYLYS